MTQEDYLRKQELTIEQWTVWNEIGHEIDNWLDLLYNLTKEFQEKSDWAHKHLAEAMERRSRENERYNLLIKEIDDKYKEETSGSPSRDGLKHRSVSSQTPPGFIQNIAVL